MGYPVKYDWRHVVGTLCNKAVFALCIRSLSCVLVHLTLPERFSNDLGFNFIKVAISYMYREGKVKISCFTKYGLHLSLLFKLNVYQMRLFWTLKTTSLCVELPQNIILYLRYGLVVPWYCTVSSASIFNTGLSLNKAYIAELLINIVL